MLNLLDDYPVHQTPEPLAHPLEAAHVLVQHLEGHLLREPLVGLDEGAVDGPEGASADGLLDAELARRSYHRTASAPPIPRVTTPAPAAPIVEWK